MVHNKDRLDAERFRESFGRCYEDFVVGNVYEHRPGRTITEADNTWFTLLTMNQHPLHFDAEYAKHFETKVGVNNFTDSDGNPQAKDYKQLRVTTGGLVWMQNRFGKPELQIASNARAV